MAITLNGTTGITTPDIDTDGLSVDTNAIFVDPATNNVGIGTSSPARVLTVSSGTAPVLSILTSITGNCQLAFGDSDDDNEGRIVYENTLDAMAFSTAALERMRIDASGNVGIGTSSPTHRLTVRPPDNNGVLISSGNDSHTGFLFFGDTTSDVAGAVSYDHFNNAMRFQTASAERMRINSAGNVGIGTNSPAQKLDVVGNAFITGILRMTGDGTAATPSIQPGNDSDTGFFRAASNVIGFSTGGTERARINSAGNVGIGTSSPRAKLEVFGGSSRSFEADGPTASIRLAATEGGFLNSYRFIAHNGTELAAMTAGGNSQAIGFLGFNVNGSERARIDSSGGLLVGCTGLTNDAPNAAGGTFKQTNGNTKIRVLSDGLAAFQFYSPTGGTSSPVGFIVVNTNNVQYFTSSDYRLKENVAPMQNALATVANLNPVTYNWKADGSVGQGFIAHELQAVVPDCVTGEKDEVRTVDVHDEEGKVIGTKEEPQYQGVDTSFLVGILTAAIQEQQTLIQALTARIEALEQA